ncbi:hypothetical protein JCM4914_49100 [Streptomyces platensis subsp. malvinus]
MATKGEGACGGIRHRRHQIGGGRVGRERGNGFARRLLEARCRDGWGGLASKIHFAVEQGQKPLSVVITAGQGTTHRSSEPVLEALRVPRLGPGPPRTRPDCAPRAPRCRVRDEPPETQQSGGHAVRQARRQRRGDRTERCPQRVAVTSTFPTALAGECGV